MKKIIIAVSLIFFLLSCREKSQWILLSAPYLMNEDEPGTGTPYLRAPLSDWNQLGEYASFQECAAAIWKPKSDPNSELHRSGRLSPAERMLGFSCVKSTDERLSSPPRYDLETAAEESK